MKKREVIVGALALLLVFVFMGCPQPNDSEETEDPEIAGFSFTPKTDLVAGGSAIVGTVAGTFSNVTGGTAPFNYSLETGDNVNDADNGSFEIDGTDLKIKAATLAAKAYKVYLRVSDSKGKTFDKEVQIGVVAAGFVSTTKTLSITTDFNVIKTYTSTANAIVNLNGGVIELTSIKAGAVVVYAYNSGRQELSISGLTVGSDGQFTGIPVESLSAKAPYYRSGVGTSVFTDIVSAPSGTTLYTTGASYPTPDPVTGKSSWNIPEGATLALVDGGQMHMHTLFNYTGPGIYKLAEGTKIMLPGGKPGNSTDDFQVSTLEIGGTLWVETPFINTSADLIYGAMTSPGGIVRLADGAKVIYGKDSAAVEAITVTGGKAYFHTIVKNLVIGKSTVTIKDTAIFGTVTGKESATYGTIVMDSDKMVGLGSGGTLVINAPGKTVTVKSIDAVDIAHITVTAGTLKILDAAGLTNATDKVTVGTSGASITINGSPYVPAQ
jgi:hypothetical protein